MRISRRGKFRDHGTTTLVKSETLRKVIWDEDDRCIRFYETGAKEGSTHRYTVQLSGEDLAQLVEQALVNAAGGERAAKAQGLATATYVRSMLCKPNDE